MKPFNHKSGIATFCLVSVFVILCLPVINGLKYGFQTDPKKLFNADVLDGYASYVVYQLLSRSKYPSKGFVGKNKFLFLGNDYGNVTYKTQGVYEYSSKEVNQWANNIEGLQAWYESQGIVFVLVMVPNKHSLYSEHLPKWVKPFRPNLTDELIAAAEVRKLSVIDLRGSLTKAKVDNNGLLYWKTDSHWSHEGAAVSFEATMDYLQDVIDTKIFRLQYKIRRSLTDAKGTAWLMKVKQFMSAESEMETDIFIENKHKICEGQINSHDFKLEPCEDSSKPYLYIHQGPKYFINSHALNPQKVLLMCDSFVGNIAELYQKSFETIWAHHYDQLTKEDLIDFVKDHKPDVVIYQIVERNLFKRGYHKNKF